MAAATVATTNTSFESTATTSHSVALPASIASGDELAISLSLRGTIEDIGIVTPSGWTKVLEEYNGGGNGLHATLVTFARIADGTEGSTVTVTTTGTILSAHSAYGMSGADETIANWQSSAVATSGNGDPDSPLLSGLTSDDYLFISAHAGGAARALSAGPAGYSNVVSQNSNNVEGVDNNHNLVGMASLETAAATSEDPGVWNYAGNNSWGAITLAIPPASAGGDTVDPDGIASAEAFGSPTVAPGAVSISPASIASLEAFGTHAMDASTIIAPQGVASLEAFGSGAFQFGGVTIIPNGVVSGEAFGTHSMHTGVVVLPSGIASAEALGSAIVIPEAVLVLPNGIPTSQTFGNLIILGGEQSNNTLDLFRICLRRH